MTGWFPAGEGRQTKELTLSSRVSFRYRVPHPWEKKLLIIRLITPDYIRYYSSWQLGLIVTSHQVTHFAENVSVSPVPHHISLELLI